MAQLTRRLSRRDWLKLAVMVVATSVGTVAILIGAAAIASHPSKGFAFIAVGEMGYAMTGVAFCALPIRVNWIPPGLLRPRWLRLPLLAWIIAVLGAVSALTNAVQAVVIVRW